METPVLYDADIILIWKVGRGMDS